MQVQAVSPVLNKGYSSVNFEGKKKDINSSHPISSSLKAVPLAVLVALSPLNTTNAENIMRSQRNDNVIELAQVPQKGKIIESKIFKIRSAAQANDLIDQVVTLESTDGDDSNFEVVRMRKNILDEKVNYDEKNVKGYEDVKAFFSTSDDMEFGPVEYSIARTTWDYNGVEKNAQFFSADLVNYIKQMTNSSKNNGALSAYKFDNVRWHISNNYSGAMKLGNSPTHLNSASLEKINLGKKVFEKKFTGDFDTYTIRGYGNSEDSKNRFETVTVQGEYFPEVKVMRVNKCKQLLSGIDRGCVIHYIQTVLADINSDRPKYSIADDKLGMELRSISQLAESDDSIKCESKYYDINIETGGTFKLNSDLTELINMNALKIWDKSD